MLIRLTRLPEHVNTTCLHVNMEIEMEGRGMWTGKRREPHPREAATARMKSSHEAHWLERDQRSGGLRRGDGGSGVVGKFGSRGGQDLR
ncbi:hypothetical protein CDL15_Pgr014719 [Punica granatum]|uniref:Uncharacterized protein n=1 Tax=Punica granatum TaxID=22663 RepID=A0A218Y0N1_PUNGR|nr:hypothetical protein CDL15_Pgr014719 [Punica granatum]